MSALMKLPVIYVYTHDSIGVGEDGPTHQPVEHISMLRITPGIYTWRPCDGIETTFAWKFALEAKAAPSALILSRQSLDAQRREKNDSILQGGYELASDQDPKITLVASGSEVSLAMKVRNQLIEQKISSRVVSMPCTEVFDEQSLEYQKETLGELPKIFIEAGQSDFWKKYCEGNDQVVGIDKFGESAPIDDLMDHFGFTVENIIKQINKII
jgi:transketolase